MRIKIDNKEVRNPIARALIGLSVLIAVVLALGFIFVVILPAVFVIVVAFMILAGIIIIIDALFGRKRKHV